MIDEQDKKIILDLARKYEVSKVFLFGSSLLQNQTARDIDLAIEGIADIDFFPFYGDLICALSRPVDVVDLKRVSKFTDMIKRDGVRLDA